MIRELSGQFLLERRCIQFSVAAKLTGTEFRRAANLAAKTKFRSILLGAKLQERAIWTRI